MLLFSNARDQHYPDLPVPDIRRPNETGSTHVAAGGQALFSRTGYLPHRRHRSSDAVTSEQRCLAILKA